LGSKLFHSFIAETHTVVNAKEKAVMEAEKSKLLKSSYFREEKQKTKQQQNKLYHILGAMRGKETYRMEDHRNNQVIENFQIYWLTF